MAKSKRKLTVFGKVLITMIGILFLVLCVLLSQLVIQLTKPEEKAPSEQEKVAQEETQEIEFSDREKAYADAHPELSEEEVIKRVAMNLDQEPYSNLQEVQDLDSDLQLVNKYYDLSVIGDTLAADHYRKLEKKASDCILCGKAFLDPVQK